MKPQNSDSKVRLTRQSALLISAVFIGLGFTGAGFAVSYGLIAMKAGERVVSVRGLAEREVDADLAVWPVTFSAASDSLDELRKDLVIKTGAVKIFLTKSGVSATDISVTPPTVRDTRAEMYGSSEPRAFRYVAQATVLARTSNIEALLNAMARSLELVGEGVAVAKDYESRPQFLFTGLNSVKPNMIAEATQNARAAAEQFAADSGSKVGKIKRANQGLFSIDDADPSLPQRKTVRVVTTVDYFLSD